MNWLVVYVGNMFGGKTASMVGDLQRAEIAGKKVQAFKVAWDNRYEEGFITANNGQLKFPATSVPNISALENLLKKVDVLGIDELQFFDWKSIELINKLRGETKIIGTALQFDYRGEPFPLREIGKKDRSWNLRLVLGKTHD